MINIDGVTLGNQRTNYYGHDLNRVYHSPSPDNDPIIHKYMQFINKIHDDQKLYFFLDLHGHSKKHDCFIYSNPTLYGEKNYFIEQMNEFIDFYSMNNT